MTKNKITIRRRVCSSSRCSLSSLYQLPATKRSQGPGLELEYLILEEKKTKRSILSPPIKEVRNIKVLTQNAATIVLRAAALARGANIKARRPKRI